VSVLLRPEVTFLQLVLNTIINKIKIIKKISNWIVEEDYYMCLVM